MAEGEPNLSVQLFVELKERYPQVPELRIRNMIKQFANNREKCLEALNKEYTSMSSPSHPNNNHHQVSNSRINYNIDSSATYSSNAHKQWSPRKNVNISETKPNSNPDFGPFIKTSSDSSTIPNIKCQSSPPVMQIAVHHITTSKPDSPNTHVFCKSPSSSSASSPNNGNQWNWPLSQKSHEVLITPTSSASTQHFAKANLYIDTPNRNMTNHQTVINPNNVGSTCVISPNPRLQPSLVRPSQIITIHSPQPGSSTGGLYSPQPGYGGHGLQDPFTHLSNTPNSNPWMPDPGFSGSPQLCIPVQVQPTTSSPSTLHHVSSTTYQTMAMPQQNIGSTTSAIIHYPAIHMNNSSSQQGNCAPSQSMKNRTANHIPILSSVVNPSDSVQMSRTRNGSLQEDPDYTNALITHQRIRYDKLNDDYKLLVAQCQELEEEIKNLLIDKKKCYSKRSFPTEIDVLELRNSTESLRLEIDNMAIELDAQNNGLTPIGVTDPSEQQHFYKNMNTGQSGSIFATAQSPNPPPRPPRYKELPHPVPPPLPDDNELIEDTWDCSACTYKNHQALNKCEICEFPRKHKAN